MLLTCPHVDGRIAGGVVFVSLRVVTDLMVANGANREYKLLVPGEVVDGAMSNEVPSR